MEKSGRSKSFSTNEINLLIMSVESNKKVVESKKKRTVTNKEKAKMWEKIALSFNSQTIEGINRDAKVLKEKWTNLKRVCDGEKLLFRQDEFVLCWIFSRISSSNRTTVFLED
jgi:hypothetical protein